MAPSSATRIKVRSPGDALPSCVVRCFSRSRPVNAPMRHAMAKPWIVAPSSSGDIARDSNRAPPPPVALRDFGVTPVELEAQAHALKTMRSANSFQTSDLTICSTHVQSGTDGAPDTATRAVGMSRDRSVRASSFKWICVRPCKPRLLPTEHRRARPDQQPATCGFPADHHHDHLLVEARRAAALPGRHLEAASCSRSSSGESACLLGKTWGYDDKGVWVVGRLRRRVRRRPQRRRGAPRPTKKKAPSYIPNAGSCSSRARRARSTCGSSATCAT